jgi:hypothetical protein
MSFKHARRAAALLVVPLVAVAAGCGGSHPTASSGTPQQSITAAWHRVVLCARAHGMPGLQDPQINSSGKAIFPSGLSIPSQTRQACQPLLDRLVPGADRQQGPTPAQLAGLLRFARCMRSHGIPDWPDPRPDGTFAPDTRISNALKSQFRSQLMACERFNPDPHGRVYFSTP